MTNQNNAAQAANKEIREAFELSYAMDADDPASATDLSHFTNGWRACIMSQVGKPVVMKLAVDATAAIDLINATRRGLRAPVADERAAFEASYRERYRVAGHVPLTYPDVPAAWEWWQARAALASAPVANNSGEQPAGFANCPITGMKFWGNIEHPTLGTMATYGGPFDTYTVPALCEDGELRSEHFDQDAGEWVEGGRPMGWAYNDQQDMRPLVASAPVAGEAFMYGIMGPDGKAHFEEFCVSGDRTELQTEVVDHLNRDNPEDGTYSVVALFRDAAPQASAEPPKLPRGWQLALNLAIDAIENAPPMDWPVNWPLIRHGLVELRDALKQPQVDTDARPCSCPSGDGSLRHPYAVHPADRQQHAREVEAAWAECRAEVGTAGWTVAESINYHGFFLHGWRAALSATRPEQGERDAD